MCQVVPYTLPCCRRAYVEVTQLPSCPDGWPEKKCPPELCIQVRYETEDRDTGTCWRCQAKAVGLSGEQRENIRPGIDRAMIVLGLDEFSPSDRRRQVEQGGKCWFCGAANGCQYCGSVVNVEADAVDEKTESHGKRKRHTHAKKEHVASKRVKVEQRSTPQPQASTAFTYPDPEQTSHWQHGYPAYSSEHVSSGFDFDQTGMTTSTSPLSQRLDTHAGMLGTTSVDWAYQQNNAQNGFGNGTAQGCSTQTQSTQPQRETFFNNQPLQYSQFLDPALLAKPEAQSDAAQTHAAPQPEFNDQQWQYSQVLDPGLDLQPTAQSVSDQTQILASGARGGSLFNNTTYQYRPFSNQDPNFKPMVQPQVIYSNTDFSHDFSNGLQFNSEDQPQFDDATIAQLLNSYNSQDSNLIQPHQLQGSPAPDQMIHQQDGSVQKRVEETFSHT